MRRSECTTYSGVTGRTARSSRTKDRNGLAASFFNRPTPRVARELLGCTLVRESSGSRIMSVITETEAYDGFEDRGSHAHRGRTARNAVMFGSPGVIYLYLCYGMHWMLNIVTREADYPAAVLIRGTSAASGPGRLTRHFRLDGSLNGMPLNRTTGLWIQPGTVSGVILTAPRVGIQYAGPEWSAMPWRFLTGGPDSALVEGGKKMAANVDATAPVA